MKLHYLMLILPFWLNAQQLPFIGTKEFNFSGGSCCNQSITIYKNGICEIMAFEAPEFGNSITVNYSGMYTPIIWVYENGEKSFGYKVDGSFIYSLDKNGNIESGCKDENKPCKELLN